jgi:hypothetical protein
VSAKTVFTAPPVIKTSFRPISLVREFWRLTSRSRVSRPRLEQFNSVGASHERAILVARRNRPWHVCHRLRGCDPGRDRGGARPAGGDPVAGMRHEVATFGIPGEGLVTDEMGHTDDGSIIIECVAFAGRLTGDTADGLRIGTVAVPHRPLGPHSCSAHEHERT